MHLFNLSLKLDGFPIKEASRVLENIQAKNEVDFETYLLQKKKDIFNYHMQNNSFYQEIAKNATITNWKNIPVMTKSDLEQPLNARLSKGFTTKNVYVNKTSGSSGDPFVFAKDKFCHALTWSVIKNRFGWFGIDFNTSKQARFYGIPLDKKGYYKERFKDFLGKRFRFSVFDLSDAAFQKCVTTFQTTRFIILMVTPVLLYNLLNIFRKKILF